MFVKAAITWRDELSKKINKYKKLNTINVKTLVNVMGKIKDILDKEKNNSESFLKNLKESTLKKK